MDKRIQFEILTYSELHVSMYNPSYYQNDNLFLQDVLKKNTN